MSWFTKNKKTKEEKLARAEQLWLWIGYANISRASVKEMIGSQNLSKVPTWLIPEIRRLANPSKTVLFKSKEDTEYEYRLTPRVSSTLQNAFLIDIHRRVRHWKKLL